MKHLYTQDQNHHDDLMHISEILISSNVLENINKMSYANR